MTTTLPESRGCQFPQCRGCTYYYSTRFPPGSNCRCYHNTPFLREGRYPRNKRPGPHSISRRTSCLNTATSGWRNRWRPPIALPTQSAALRDATSPQPSVEPDYRRTAPIAPRPAPREPDEEMSRRARDTSRTSAERLRYQKEEKARGLRNQQKRGNKNSNNDPSPDCKS